MTYRKLLLAACASAGLLVAFGGLAMPFDTLKTNAASVVGLAGYRESDDDDHRKGHRRHDDDRQASNDCRGDDDDDDDDDDDGACGGRGSRGGAMQQQNATPPANGLFAPGSKPNVQMN